MISTIPQAQPDRQLTCASLCASLCVCVSRACGAARWACPSSAPSRSQWAPSWKRLERRQPSDGAAREGRVAGSCWSAAPAPRGMTGHVASSCWIWSPAPLPSTLPLASPRHGRPPGRDLVDLFPVVRCCIVCCSAAACGLMHVAAALALPSLYISVPVLQTCHAAAATSDSCFGATATAHFGISCVAVCARACNQGHRIGSCAAPCTTCPEE